MQTHFEHCAALVREADRDRYLATLFAPAEHRDALYALYAFNVEIARVRELAREPLPGEIRLQWWREVLLGERDGEAVAHPVAAALRETLARYGLASDRLIALIDARAFDLYDEPMASFADLEAYGDQISGTVFEYAGRILAGKMDKAAVGLMMDTGLAQTHAHVIARFPHHFARGQLYIPLEVLRGSTREDVFANQAAAALKFAMAELAVHARGHLLKLAGSLAKFPAAALPAILPVAPLRRWLTLMDAQGYDPFNPPEIAPWLRQWRIWRAAKNPRRIGYRLPLFIRR